MKNLKIFLVLFAALLITGCSPSDHSEQAPSCRIVEQIHIEFEDGPLRAQRLYTDPEKMRRILNYIRSLMPFTPTTEKPEDSQGSLFRITLSHSDGCKRIYMQRSDRFLSENHGPWMEINPQKAQELSLILGEMESDR